MAQNYTLLRRRWRSPFAEVDLVLRDAKGALLLVEVKSVLSLEFLHIRLTWRQKSRLKRCLLYCVERNPNVSLELAVVSQRGEVLIFRDIFG